MVLSAALLFTLSTAATLAGAFITNTSVLANTPSQPELALWTLSGVNAGLLASLTVLHQRLPQPLSINASASMTLTAAILLLTAGAIGHFAATTAP